MRSSSRALAVLLALWAGVARAHLLPSRPDLDRWLVAGQVVVAEASGPSSPCGHDEFPAVQALIISDVLAGDVDQTTTSVIVLDDHAPALREGEVGLIVLRASEGVEAPSCATLPPFVLHGPYPAPIHVAGDEDAWRGYIAALARLPDGPGRDHSLQKLWAAALGSGVPVLAEHAAGRLGRLSSLTPRAQATLVRLIENQDADPGARARAVRLAGDSIAPLVLAKAAGDPDLRLAEEAMARLIGAGDVTPDVRSVLRNILALTEGERPVDYIRRAGVSAALASEGDPVGRDVLLEGLAHPLFKVRVYSVRGVAYLGIEGDPGAAQALRARLTEEPDRRVLEVIERALSDLGNVRRTATRRVLPAHTGLRMLLVLLGLGALLFMLALPGLERRLRGRRAD